MLVIICEKYGENPSRTVRAVEWTNQDVAYFTNFVINLNDLLTKLTIYYHNLLKY